MTRPQLATTRPTLPESEYRIRQWLRDQLWATNYVGRVIARLMIEYDHRGEQLGIPPVGRVDDST